MHAQTGHDAMHGLLEVLGARAWRKAWRSAAYPHDLVERREAALFHVAAAARARARACDSAAAAAGQARVAASRGHPGCGPA